MVSISIKVRTVRSMVTDLLDMFAGNDLLLVVNTRFSNY